MHSDQVPQAARLPDSEIAKCVQGSPAYQVTKWDRAIADAASDLAYRGCHQEALDAAAGLVAAGDKMARRHAGWEQGMGKCVCEAHKAWDTAQADWNKFKEAGNG